MADVPGDGEGLDVEARSYQLVPTAQCPDGGLIPEKGTSIVVYSQLVHKLQAFDPEWEARLANEVCLVRVDTLRKHDMLIRDGTHGKRSDDRQFRRTLSPRGARVQYTEIHDSGTVVLRRLPGREQETLPLDVAVARLRAETTPPDLAATYGRIAGGEDETYSGTIEGADLATGRHRAWQITAFPVRRPDGRNLGAGVVLHDITEQLKAEKELRRSERNLADFFENASFATPFG